MKAIKIILLIVVLAVISFLVKGWFVEVKDVGIVKPAENQYTKRIESEIDSLGRSSVNVFSSKLYQDILYLITDYHKQGFLGKSANDNEQWKDILQKNLYSVYAPKFVEQAMYVFNGSDWKIDHLKFIRSEVKKLQKSSYLERNSSVDTLFGNIQCILMKYDEIANFIATTDNFSYSNYELSARFPDVSDKVQKACAYLENNLDNYYVKNCVRLKNGLKQIPQSLFKAHVAYLEHKIDKWSGQYSNYSSQGDYSDNLYEPLKSEIEALENIYGVQDFDEECERLLEKWSADNVAAYDYEYPTIN